ncbi:RNase adapter RapZ [Rhodopila sp.]|uniref:RNase adapter RapZ n=1 Tax=Rhodopila sp. TaxID=2480087 RepID=UPI003D0BD40B
MSDTASLAVVIVSGLSGGGKASVLRALEDVGYEAVDNPPLQMLEDMVARGDHKLAVGIDARTRGFDATMVLEAIGRLRANPALRVELVYTWADEATLLRRFTETRRRHPLVPQGRVLDGIAAEQVLTADLRQHADLVVDTSDLPLAGLRRLIEQHFGAGTGNEQSRMVVSLISFAYPRGLPPEADLVFDARFLRNPHYDPILRSGTGLDEAVAAYVEADPDFANYFTRLTEFVDFVLPRFVQEGKKYATITIGCTGGRHRSVHLIEKLANHLTNYVPAALNSPDDTRHWRLHVTHRELAREGMQGGFLTERPVALHEESDLDKEARTLTAYPQEA